VRHARNGNFWIFDSEVIESLAKEDKSRITVSEVKRTSQENGKGMNAVNTQAEGKVIDLKKIFLSIILS
jgi:hypothetical protein